jgi:hypothetical protein
LLRGFLAVVLGYAAIVILVMVLFTALYAALGPSGAFEPSPSWQPSALWLILTSVAGAAAALLGGALAAWVGRGLRPAVILACVVGALGLAQAAMMLARPAQGQIPRPEQPTREEINANTRTPPAVALGNAVFGASGVSVGGFAIARRRRSAFPNVPPNAANRA